ncbi:MAG TPA: DEAD/DEAH box helicase [Deferrisomatales bacterium]|nr:DEAD/DEAH box helicase [Deferrisomatales bacterium]
MNFEAFELHPHLLAGIRRSTYTEPTPIQAQVIPKILAGKDVLGVAQTGTGKTAAFAIPILQRLMEGPRRGSRALVIVPTRELAEQIHGSFTVLGRKVNVQSTPVYGGVGMQPQIDRLRNGKDIVIACPGRLLDHLERGTIDLSQVETLVLDEADRMFDMGFLPDLRKIIARLPRQRQSLLFAATMPEEVQALANKVLRQPEVVRIDQETIAVTVSHTLYPVGQGGKTDLLLRLLHHTDTQSVLVFTQTRDLARRLADTLGKAGHRATSLQADLSQGRRQAALDGFRDGTYQILVATDIAARGLDVSTISHVINYDMPNTVDDYAHRIGRTGRACRGGHAVSLVTPDDTEMVRAIEATLGANIEPGKTPGPCAPRAGDNRRTGRGTGGERGVRARGKVNPRRR